MFDVTDPRYPISVEVTDPIEVVDGTFDSVRNPGGSSYSRPIIEGGQKS
jgi:hypothetical protein